MAILIRVRAVGCLDPAILNRVRVVGCLFAGTDILNAGRPFLHQKSQHREPGVDILNELLLFRIYK